MFPPFHNHRATNEPKHRRRKSYQVRGLLLWILGIDFLLFLLSASTAHEDSRLNEVAVFFTDDFCEVCIVCTSDDFVSATFRFHVASSVSSSEDKRRTSGSLFPNSRS
jgi:hypothetical protein